MPRQKSRSEPTTPNPALQRRRRLQNLRAKLEAERQTWTRWLSRLKRAFHSVEKIHARIGRLERQISRLENAPS